MYGSICNPGGAGQRHMYPVDHDMIIQRVLAGDSRAYAELVRHYQRMVHTVCMCVLRNAEDAEEATQDSFVKAYQHLAAFGGKAKFSTWLYSIAYRTAISHGRKVRMEGNFMDEQVQLAVADADTSGHTSEVRRLLEHALAQLDPEDASLLSFFHLEELTIAEIVTITGLGASNVKVRLHRARKKLVEVIEATYGYEAQHLILDHA
jgi:RNA polymerase sigma factor (sigma-70 family)